MSFLTTQGLMLLASPHTTIVYVHVSEERRRAAVNKLEITPTGRPEEPKVVELQGVNA